MGIEPASKVFPLIAHATEKVAWIGLELTLLNSSCPVFLSNVLSGVCVLEDIPSWDNPKLGLYMICQIGNANEIYPYHRLQVAY